MLFDGRVVGKDTASAPQWCLQHASLRCCHLLHAYHCGSREGMKPPGEDTRSPASGTSLLVPADEVWQHPKPAAGGRDLVGLLRDPADCCRKRKPPCKQAVVLYSEPARCPCGLVTPPG